MFDYAGGGAAKAVCGGVEPSLSNDTLVQVFREGWGPNDPQPGKVCGSNGAVTTAEAVRAGYHVIWGPPASWYLSCYADTCSASGNGAGFQPWAHQVYAAEPFFNAKPPFNIKNAAERARIVDGEVTVWSERLDPAHV